MLDPENHDHFASSRSVLNVAAICASLVIGATALWLAVLSLHWRIEHDLPVVLYFGWLINGLGFVPYRDIYDPNMPGTYLLSIIIGRLSDYHDFGVRCFDLAWLAAICGLTAGWMRRMGWRQAALGPALFALIYLSSGPAASLQREYCLLLPVTAAMFIVFGLRPGADIAKAIAAGLLLGIGFTIKPHVVVLMPWIMLFHVLEIRERANARDWITRRNLLTAAGWIAGAAIPAAAAFIYIWRIGAWPAFWDMASHYWGLYGHLTGQHESLSPGALLVYRIANSITANPMILWVPVSLLGLGSSLLFGGLASSQRRMVVMLACLSVVSVIYVALAGKFFEYHWMLHSFFLCQLAALNFTPMKRASRKIFAVLPASALIFTLIFVGNPYLLVTSRFHKTRIRSPKYGRVDAIANYLKANMRPGDKVQPMDWTDGALHAMLEARAPLASRFPADYMFCHDVSNPYIQKLRGEFSQAMEQVPPRFIIHVDTVRPHGLDCDDNTTALIPKLKTDYRIALTGDHFELYERIVP